MESEPLPFKRLTKQNWCEPDPILRHFVTLEIGGTRGISREEWAESFLRPLLDLSVPEEIRHMFEVARGALCYGYYFYPMFALGTEQLYRVSEAAVRHKHTELNRAQKPTATFQKMLRWLRTQNVLDETQFQRWSAVRDLRNMTTHAREQFILLPGEAGTSLEVATELINSLFGD